MNFLLRNNQKSCESTAQKGNKSSLNDDLKTFFEAEEVEEERVEAFSEVVTLLTLVGYSISTFLATLDFCARTSKALEAIKINIESAKHCC